MEFELKFDFRFSRVAVLACLGLLGSIWAGHGYAQSVAGLTGAQAERVNSAAAQRMLSQRMAKAYAQALLGVLPAQSQEILANSTKRFLANQALLRGAGLPTEVQQLITAVDAQAAPLLATVATAPTKEGLAIVAKASDDTLAAAEALVKGLPALSIPGASPHYAFGAPANAFAACRKILHAVSSWFQDSGGARCLREGLA